MGREIRRVPKNWQHPKDQRGEYRPMYDQTFAAAAAKWKAGFAEWEAKTHECYQEGYEFWDYYDHPPDPEYYRPEFNDEATHYQIYETVSEGTPVSPVFATKEEMLKWLIAHGYSQKAAEKFIDIGHACSLTVFRDDGHVRIFTDIQGLDANQLGEKQKGGSDV